MALQLSASDYPIKSVTVFKSSKAEVVRTFALDLKAGQNKVQIKGLAGTIDTQSVRVSGLGSARLFDVVCTLDATTLATPTAKDSLTEAIRVLKVKKLALESEKRVREHEADLLVNYAKTLTGEHVTPIQMASFLESFVEQGRKNLASVTVLGEDILAIDREIEKITQAMMAKKGVNNGEVTVVIGVDEDSSVELKLTYIVQNAFWEPTYELRATIENGKPSSHLSLHYRARVVQSTGEDWNDTALTLSTVASDMVKNIPNLPALKLRQKPASGLFGNQMQQQQSQPPRPATTLAFGQPAFNVLNGPGASAFGAAVPQSNTSTASFPGLFGRSGGGLFGQSQPQMQSAPASHTDQTSTTGTETHSEEPSEGFEEITTPVPAAFSESTTLITATPLAVSYSVEGKSSVPSDGVKHQVSIAVLTFEGKITYVCVPRIDPRVWLQCYVKNTSDYRLLPGNVTVILGESFVSNTSIQDINTGDTFTCTLGADSATKVTYSRKSNSVKAQGGAFSELSNTTTYTSEITIHNKHAFALEDLVVKDGIPTCDEKRAKVILREPEGLADADEREVVKLGNGLKVAWQAGGGEKVGKYEWRWRVDGGEKISLKAQWELKGPAEMQWEQVQVW